MEECPICDVEFEGESVLCPNCNSNRFYDNDDKEIEYRDKTKVMIDKLKEVFGDDYDDVLHDDMVRQLVRCEINMRHYEKKIANDDESKIIMDLLRSERNHWKNLADKLNLTIKSIRKDTKFMKHDVVGDFREYLLKAMESMDANKPKEKSEEDNG
ncbi:MAG: hypothetical protein ACTSSE_08575 [Candidatus Thorarchaeota archaeon]